MISPLTSSTPAVGAGEALDGMEDGIDLGDGAGVMDTHPIGVGEVGMQDGALAGAGEDSTTLGTAHHSTEDIMQVFTDLIIEDMDMGMDMLTTEDEAITII